MNFKNFKKRLNFMNFKHDTEFYFKIQ
jgi:hypothetical protein